MGEEVEDIEGDKRLHQSRENGRLTHTNTQSMCSWLSALLISSSTSTDNPDTRTRAPRRLKIRLWIVFSTICFPQGQ